MSSGIGAGWVGANISKSPSSSSSSSSMGGAACVGATSTSSSSSSASSFSSSFSSVLPSADASPPPLVPSTASSMAASRFLVVTVSSPTAPGGLSVSTKVTTSLAHPNLLPSGEKNLTRFFFLDVSTLARQPALSRRPVSASTLSRSLAVSESPGIGAGCVGMTPAWTSSSSSSVGLPDGEGAGCVPITEPRW